MVLLEVIVPAGFFVPAGSYGLCCWYALTHAPLVVFDSLVKQFWATAVVRPNVAGSHDLVATIDGREVVVTESLIRTQLQFDVANGTLTFLKIHLSPQWRFLVHTIMH
ncbi:hypothetical protein Tco_0101507, partial [Tanacetum coccineum]